MTNASNDTLRIAEIAVGPHGGRLGITIAPGKRQPHGFAGPHERDLGADLDAVAAWDAGAVVTLMEAHELDFNQCFRKLGTFTVAETESLEGRKEVAGRFFHHEGVAGGEEAARERVAKWLEQWRGRVLEDWGEGKDQERKEAMNQVNPKVSLADRSARPSFLLKSNGR